MTSKQTQKLLPVLQAWAQGKNIQVRAVHGFPEQWTTRSPIENCNEVFVDFTNASLEWQLAPKPKDYWLAGERVYLSSACKQKDQVIFISGPVHVREVLP